MEALGEFKNSGEGASSLFSEGNLHVGWNKNDQV